jgi:hypothetical protein
MVRVPLRAAVPVLGTAEYCTVPFPLPDAPETMDIHAALDAAVQAQPVPAVTFTLPFPPPAATAALVGEILYVQDAAAAACVTVNVFPPTVSVAVREAVLVFAAAV